MVDEHYYEKPEWFLANQQRYDRYDRAKSKVYLGEYASRGNTLGNALAEAAYYLSDPIAPDERARLLTTAERSGEERRADVEDELAAGALGLLIEAADELDRLVRGPSANSEIRIARKAVSRAICELARHVGIATDRLRADSPHPGRLAALRPGHRERR